MALGFGIALGFIGLGMLCALLFRLAVYALPAYAAVATGLYVYGAGAGIAGATVLAVFAGSAVLALGQTAFNARTLLVRRGTAILFAIAAAIAGYSVGHGLSGIGVTAEMWQQVIGAVGAAMTATTALMHLAPSGRTETDPQRSPAQD